MPIRNHFHNIIITVILILTTGCSINNKQPSTFINFIPNQNVYTLFVSTSTNQPTLIMNLKLNHTPDIHLTKEQITKIELLPPTVIVDFDSFRIATESATSQLVESGLVLRFTPEEPGEHTFTEAVITTKQTQYRLPLGNITIRLTKGPLAPIFLLPYQAGIFGDSQPLMANVENDTSEPMLLRELRFEHPLITFRPEDLWITDATGRKPFGPHGFLLAPGQKVLLEADWDVQLPKDQTLNIEAVALLVASQNGQNSYINLQNMVYRSEPWRHP